MDQRTTTIDQDLKDIVDTRVAIAEKLELLEQRIIDTAEGATMKFSRMLDETTQSVNQMVDKTKAALDPIHKVDEYPWLMLGGAVCAGLVIGLLDSRSRRGGVYPYYPSGAHASHVMPESGRDEEAAKHQKEGIYEYYPSARQSGRDQGTDKRQSGMWDGLMREFGQEAEQAKAALIEVGRSVMTELVRKMVPEIAKSLGVNLSAQRGTDQDSSQGRETSKPAYGAATGGRFTTTR
jgi:ElaB/YqjD/DUF883 family membrane-anchored ribosome-binding protein